MTPISNKALTFRLLVLVVAMFGFGFMLVPLYDVFFDLTGFGGGLAAKEALLRLEMENSDFSLDA